MASNRSPSPLSSRSVIPPHPSRTSENANSTARRSFNGNPLSRPSVLSTHRGFNPPTPANSPADSKRISNSGTKGGSEEKENELKVEKLRSPLKDCKNFMSPTISASSKIASSPKKKILVERNDPVRTSISLSDGKATFFSANSDNHSKIVKSMEGTVKLLDTKETVLVTKPPKKVTFSEELSNCSNESESHSDTVVMDSEICNDKPLLSPVIAHLDADPSLPPYDPITNYLSPRPQFRRYEPVPRFEPDNFLSELLSDSFSNIEGSESSQTEDSLKESDEMLNEATDGSFSEEIVTEVVVDQEEEEAKISEPVITPVIGDIAEAKMRTKLSYSTKSKLFSLLLVLLIALVSFSVTDSPMLATPCSIDLRFSNNISSDIPVFAKANDYFKKFSREAISYMSMLIYDLGRMNDFQKPLKFMNLTGLEEESSKDKGYLIGSIGNEELDEELEPIELEEDEESAIEPAEEEVHMEADLDDDNEVEGANDTEIEEGDLESEQASAVQLAEVNEEENDLEQEQHDLESEEASIVGLAEGNESDSVERDLVQGLTVSNGFELVDAESSVADSEAVVESMNENYENLVKDDSAVKDAQPLEMVQSPIDRHENDAQPLEMQPSPIDRNGDNVGSYQILGISSLVLGLLAAAAVLMRSNKTLKPMVHADQVSSKKFETQHVVKHSSQHWPTEVDVAGQYCSTEMSSLQISSFYSKKYSNSVNDEAQSTEKKTRKINRREPLATLEYSVGTTSYGSFTTHEKIPIKHAGRGEEVITTPVRRSSRIRSHVISP